ncbi:MAG: helix-turn-helix transcriptional regulator [Alphaproteobacteria bacterium]|nr:helix-turn-helix transcriptional regulator [Alphaproteobacteria bacterium]
MIEENLDIKQSNDFIKALIQKQSRRKLVELTQNTDCSMDQLARLSGVNEEVLSAMINGEREITPNMLARILDVYNYFGEEDLLFNQMVC